MKHKSVSTIFTIAIALAISFMLVVGPASAAEKKSAGKGSLASG